MVAETVEAIKIFYCYAHEDRALLEELEKHLSPLRRLKKITGWLDRDIQSGEDWASEIKTQLDEAKIILLLVSPDFIYSDYCYSIEMQRALERCDLGEAVVIPIILRPVSWEDTPIGKLEVLPAGGKPVTQWANRDEAWVNVAGGVSQVIRGVLSNQVPLQRSSKLNSIPGCTLRQTLSNHRTTPWCMAWAPDEPILAASADRFVYLWNAQTGLQVNAREEKAPVLSLVWSSSGQPLSVTAARNTMYLRNIQTGTERQKLFGGTGSVVSLAWSPDQSTLASGTINGSIILQDAIEEKGQTIYGDGDMDLILSLAWSPDQSTLASGTTNGTITLWDTKTKVTRHIFRGHQDKAWSSVGSLAWSPEGSILASGSEDCTVSLWDVQTGQRNILEGHTDPIWSLAFSNDGRLLASFSYSHSESSGTVRIWRTDIWEPIAILDGLASGVPGNTANACVAFHPKLPILATLGIKHSDICIWDLNLTELLRTPSSAPDTVRYTNAKVVLMGDSGVGKSGLGLVLAGNPFISTESSHGRHIWSLGQEEIQREDLRTEIREILLWDLAGQPGYRLIHQLHLDEVALALVIFDARSETDPFSGVQYWDRAIKQAQSVQGDAALPLKKFLVAARIDRGGTGVSDNRIQALMQDMNFHAYFETSAKQGYNIAELRSIIKKSLEWNRLPTVSSTQLFQDIKTFLVAEKEAGHLLASADDLYRLFLISRNFDRGTSSLRTQFETCIGRVESVGFIKRLSFGNLILLQPELLDAYASALVNAVKDEPDGLGCITEERARLGDFFIPEDERLKDKEQEKLLMIALVEDLLRREIILREEPFLVFPSQTTREKPDFPEPQGKTVMFSFEGAVLNIYATLAVRLANSELFKRKEFWKNAFAFTDSVSGVCGIFLNNTGEGYGEITLFFDRTVNEHTRFYFEQYVQIHLQRKALPESICRRRIFTCSECDTVMPDYIVQSRIKRNSSWMTCPVCEKHISLLDREERLTLAPSGDVLKVDRTADRRRDREAAKSTIQGKRQSNDFDVFLCYNTGDKTSVRRLAEQLQEQGILPWFDEWELRPGLPWQRALEMYIAHIKTAAVCVGNQGIGPWQKQELEALLYEFVNRGCLVIPVLLPGASEEPQLPLFLNGMTWVDFRAQDPEALERLIWGITGERNR